VSGSDPFLRDAATIERWLRETDGDALETLWAAADACRREQVGEAVHFRGLIEISSHCVRRCAYCGLTAGRTIERYRMTDEEILACAREAVEYGYGTVVLQAGEDPGLDRDRVAGLVRALKSLPGGLAVTLSLGERTDEEFSAWREAGADRYLLRFETSDPDLYRRIHPSRIGEVSDRIAMLRRLRAFGYEPGSGVMVGIPGQTWAGLVRDLATFRELDLDMIGIGPYLPHPDTALGRGEIPSAAPAEQVPPTELTVYKMVALARLHCPTANLPSTTALATINKAEGRELGLRRGANVVMPNLTPVRYRRLYEIYPSKACIDETAKDCRNCLRRRVESIGRTVGKGRGSRGGQKGE